MKEFLTGIILVVFLFCMAFSGAAQEKVADGLIPQQYIFFSADTLQGFDLSACFNDLGRYNVHSHLSEGEKRSYMHGRQLDFVRTKYHIEVSRPYIDPLKTIEFNEKNNIQPPAFHPRVMGIPNSSNTINGPGKLFRQGQSPDPSLAATNPSCVGWDWENGLGPKGIAAWANPTAVGLPNTCPTCTGSWFADVMYTANPNSSNWQGNAEGVGLHDPNGNDASVLTKCDHHVIVSTGNDPYGNVPMVCPSGGSYSVRLGGPNVNLGGVNPGDYGGVCNPGTYAGPGQESSGEIIWTNINVTAQNALLTYYYSVFLADGGASHSAGEQPYFDAFILNTSGGCTTCPVVSCSNYTQQCTHGTPPTGYTSITNGWNGNGQETATNVFYSGWQANTVDLAPFIGGSVQVQFMVAGCVPGGHFGYAYIDGTCGPVQLVPQSSPVCAGTGNLSVSAPPMPPGTTYSWSPTTNIVGSSTGSSINVSAAGTYSVTITPPAPNNTCPITISSSVNFTPSPSINTSLSTNITCKGLTNGTASASGSGTSGYSYSWSWSSGSAATQAINNLGVNTYTVTVTDVNSCTASTVVSITQPSSAITAAAAQQTSSTCGNSNGQAVATPGGGTPGPGYTYAWSPSGGAAQTASGLAAGTYVVTITDHNGCSATSSAIISGTGAGDVAGITSATNVSCKGGLTGSATATVTSGSAAVLTYSWSNLATTPTINNVAAGTYIVTITDANACTSSATVILTQPTSVLSASATPVSSNCLPNNGQITINPGGGTSGYSEAWSSPGPTGPVGSGLASGTYTVTVTDAKGCTITTSATVSSPSSVLTPVTSSDSSSCGKNNGSVFANPTGGTPGYTYLWSPGGSAQTISNLASGTYSLTVTDINGCSQTAIQTVSDAGGSTILLSANPVISCFAGSNGTVTANVTGGTAPLSFAWSNGLTGTTTVNAFTSVITGLDSGIYVLNVTDVHGCLSSSSFTLHAPPQINPIISAGNQTNVTCNGLTNGQATLTTSGGTGTLGYAWPANAGNSTTATATNLAPGTYTVTVTDANSCSVTTTVIITQPNPLSLSTSYVAAICGNPTGSVSAAASGGTALYNYVWTPGGPGDTITGLVPGNYQVMVTDHNGCTFSTSQSVSDSSSAIVTLSGPSSSICIGQSATLSSNVVGGTLPLKYNWSTMDTIPGPLTETPLTTTTYSLTVTDAKGCTSAVQTITIKVNKPLNVTLSSTGSMVCNGASATLTATASGGNGNYTYNWLPSGSGSSFTINPTANITYFVTVTDNCDSSIANTTISITVDVPPTVSISSGENSGCSAHPVCIQFTGTSNPPGACVSTEWYFGDSDSSSQANPNHCYNAAGVYSVTMKCTDANGCSSISAPGSSTITISQSPVAAFTYSPSTLLTQDSAIAFTSHSSVTTVSWNFGDTASLANDSSILVNPIHTYKDSGSYCIRLVAFNLGCVDTIKHCIFINEACTLPKQIPNVFSPNDDGINDIFTIKSTGLRDLLCTMYNRWGMEIYQYDAVKTGWDGRTFSDGKAPEGTYYYVLKADCLTSPDQLKGQGFLQLVR